MSASPNATMGKYHLQLSFVKKKSVVCQPEIDNVPSSLRNGKVGTVKLAKIRSTRPQGIPISSDIERNI